MTYDFATRIKQIEAELAALKIAHASGSQATVYDSQVQIKDAASNNIGSFTVNQSTASNITIPSGSDSTLGLVKVDSALSTSSTNAVQNKLVTAALNGKLADYNLDTRPPWTAGDHPMNFLTVDYTNDNSENASFFKIGMICSHGNGNAYRYFQDVIINVQYTGAVSVDIYRYFGTNIPSGTYAGHQYGDIFWTIDTSAKKVYFYILNGQYTRLKSTPYKFLGNNDLGVITQITGYTTDYSSGAIGGWATRGDLGVLQRGSTRPTFNGSDLALLSDTSTVSATQILSSGTKIGTVTVNGTDTDFYAPSASAGLITFGTDSSYWYFDRNTNQGTTTTVNLPSADVNRVESSYSAIFSSGYSGALTFGAQLVVKNSTTYFRRYGFRTGSFSSGEGNYNAGDATFTTAFITGSGNWNRVTFKQTALRIGTGNQWMLMVDVAASGNATTEHYDVQCETTSPTIAPGVYVRSSPFTPSSIHREGSMWVG